MRQLISALRRGETVGLLPDQVPPEGQGVWRLSSANRLHHDLVGALCHHGQRRVLLAWGERLSWGRGYVVHVLPLEQVLSEPLADDAAAVAARFNRAMEALILRFRSGTSGATRATSSRARLTERARQAGRRAGFEATSAGGWFAVAASGWGGCASPTAASRHRRVPASERRGSLTSPPPACSLVIWQHLGFAARELVGLGPAAPGTWACSTRGRITSSSASSELGQSQARVAQQRRRAGSGG